MFRMNANSIIDSLGGTNAVALLCKVSPQAVSQWREDGIPKARLMFLELARPDVFASQSQGVQQSNMELTGAGTASG